MMDEHPFYKDEEVKRDLVGGVLNYLVYQEVGPDRLVELRKEASAMLDGMTGSQMRRVVALLIRQNTDYSLREERSDLLELIAQVKEGS